MDEDKDKIKIFLDENTKVSFDGLSYVISRKSVAKSGVERWVAQSYFPNIEMLAQELLDLLPGLDADNVADLKELIKIYNKSEKKILNMLAKFGEAIEEYED